MKDEFFTQEELDFILGKLIRDAGPQGISDEKIYDFLQYTSETVVAYNLHTLFMEDLVRVEWSEEKQDWMYSATPENNPILHAELIAYKAFEDGSGS